MTTLEILRAARALIAQPGRWTQGAAARDGLSSACHPQEAVACSYCAYGAVRAAGDASYLAAYSELFGAATEAGYESPIDLNDTTDLPTVLAMFDATIARLEGQNG